MATKRAKTEMGANKSLQDLTKEDLISYIKQLETNVQQLKNIINKSSPKTSDQKCKKVPRPFDFCRFKKIHVALKVAYLGWDYQGFVVQNDHLRTIEEELFNALIKTKLIENRESSNYHRCGRTDKGVSAFGQVISLDLRSSQPVSSENSIPLNSSNISDLRYINILNKVLPPEIRVLAWLSVPPDFSARFNCLQRTYKYFFPKGSLDIEIMRKTGQILIGEHDFRNLCKMDVANGVTNYSRRILLVDIAVLDHCENGYQMCELTIVGQAFLWHQIRCIVSILFLIGEGKEKPQLLSDMLDIENNPRKPQYNMASELPLNLFHCEFESLDWQYDKEALQVVIAHFQSLWCKEVVKATMIKRMLDSLHSIEGKNITNQNSCLIQGLHSSQYKPILMRPKCESLENRINYFTKKRQISPNNIK